MARILLVDDESLPGTALQRTLEHLGHEVLYARSVIEALQVLARAPADLVISDFCMPGLSGLDLLELMRQDGYDIPIIILTGYGTIEHAVSAIKNGAVDYVSKPVQLPQIQNAVDQALELVRLRRENERMRMELAEVRSGRQLLGESPAIRRALQMVASAAPTRATVLIHGESGTGKELFARTIHELSERHSKPFIKLNCAALPEGLIESALFGHEKGAFTGAVKRVEGAFERAHGGTLLLDEISEMRLDLQAKLLRVLQEQEFERVGGMLPLKVDVRVIATTNRDLAAEAAAGHFREDLYYRLNVIPIEVPPLRERPLDIPILVHRFAQRTAEENGREFHGITCEALDMLVRESWRGNVRELQHAVERAVILSGDHVLEPKSFEFLRSRAAQADDPASQQAPSGPVLALSSFDLAEAEAKLIERALEATGDNRTRAARLLGISVRTLRSKLNAPPTAGQEEEPSLGGDEVAWREPTSRRSYPGKYRLS
ncbi:MAG TPA: sigma-54 dependent transcriptional regulator [Gemmatimonadaceae bacterium]|jgi:DNA-binding NtrC family response regulator|nr:sigma-54 dependent transcriptional regulator [Gemmatimonadaceae bacterium]